MAYAFGLTHVVPFEWTLADRAEAIWAGSAAVAMNIPSIDVEAGGMGTVYSTTVNRRSPEKGGTFNLCLIDLDEGVRMLSRVVDMAPEDVAIGMKVKARIGGRSGFRILRIRRCGQRQRSCDKEKPKWLCAGP